MPQNLVLAAFVVGAVFVLLAISAGSFKIFGVEMSGANGRSSRIVAGVAGAALIAFALVSTFRGPADNNARQGAVMGALEMAINRNHGDLDSHGTPAVDAENCAEQCRTDVNCRAATFVISQKWCWKKGVVPPPTNNNDMISAVKVRSED